MGCRQAFWTTVDLSDQRGGGGAPHSRENKVKVVVERIALEHWLGGTRGTGGQESILRQQEGSQGSCGGDWAICEGQPGDRSEMEKGLFTSLGRSGVWGQNPCEDQC